MSIFSVFHLCSDRSGTAIPKHQERPKRQERPNVKRLNVKRPAHNPIAKPAEQRQPFDKVVVF